MDGWMDKLIQIGDGLTDAGYKHGMMDDGCIAGSQTDEGFICGKKTHLSKPLFPNRTKSMQILFFIIFIR